jgi:glycosyltransferase involved in cell wall biosynthesis
MLVSDKKIRILQIVGEPIGGIRKHVHDIILRLDQEEFLLYYSYSSTNADSKFRNEINKIKLILNGDLVLHIKKKPHYTDLYNIYRLIKFVKFHNINVIHGHGSKGGLYARLAGFLCSIPSLYTPHGGVVHGMFGRIENTFYNLTEWFLSYFTSLYIFESKYTAESFFSKVTYVENHVINNNGIAFPKFHESVSDNEDCISMKIGVFASLRKEKGQEFLLMAFADARLKKKLDVTLSLFGSGPDYEKLKELVSILKIDKYVTFYGDVNNPDFFMAQMDVIVIPSLFESFGYVGLEAVSHMKPVIASKVGGLCEIFDDETALMVEPGDVTSLSKAIENFYDDPKLRSSIARSAYKKCTNLFCVHKMLLKLSYIYRKVFINV